MKIQKIVKKLNHWFRRVYWKIKSWFDDWVYGPTENVKCPKCGHKTFNDKVLKTPVFFDDQGKIERETHAYGCSRPECNYNYVTGEEIERSERTIN